MVDLDSRSQEKRREQKRKSQDSFRKKTRAKVNNNSDDDKDMDIDKQPSTSQELDENVVSSTSDTHVTVKMPFPQRLDRGVGGKKRASRALAKSYRTIETLEDKHESLRKKLKTAQKRLQRYESRKECSTPRSKNDRLLKNAGLVPAQVPDIRKQLIYSECLNDEIKNAEETQEKSCSRVHVVQKIISGRVMEAYRLKSTMERKTTLNRRKSWSNKAVETAKKSKLKAQRVRLTQDITTFLERDDNSRMMPGKADAVKGKQGKVQKRELNDHMYNLHMKFLVESTTSISRAPFYRCRPNHISLVNFASRSVCLCAKHQNFSFLLRALKCIGVCTCTNPDKFIQMINDNPELLREILDKIPASDDIVKFQQWRRVKEKERQRVVEVQKERVEFVEMVVQSTKEFEGHAQRVKDQYIAIRDMKERRPPNHVLIQMDFSENYTCTKLEEIQSAYRNSSKVTLHPVVIYYRPAENQFEHSSYVYVSEVSSHNSSMVISIIDKVSEVVKRIVPSVSNVHFWTDSPSSQYRNKTIFDLVSRFNSRYGLTASWHYFECGHGKGPCDGVGGTTKRNADKAVKQGRALIQDAHVFFAWASTQDSTIKYELVTEEEYETNKAIVDKRNTIMKLVKSTMKLHAVVGTDTGSNIWVQVVLVMTVLKEGISMSHQFVFGNIKQYGKSRPIMTMPMIP